MSMELKRFTDGKLPVAKTALYTCPADKTARVWVSLANVDTSIRRVVLYTKASAGTSRVYADFDFGIRHTAHTPRQVPIILEAGDSVEGQCPDGATYIDYVINGMLETLTIT